MEIYIRKAELNDAYEIGLVHTLSWQAAYKDIIPDDYLNNMKAEDKAERFIKNYYAFKDAYYYVVTINEKIIGNLVLHKSRDIDKPLAGEIVAIYLLPSLWNNGCGKQMMDFAVKNLRDKGYNEIFLWVLKDNKRARNFYEKYGFVFDGTEKEIFIGKPLVETRYVFSKI